MSNTVLTYEQRFINAARFAEMKKGYFATVKTSKEVFCFEFVRRRFDPYGESKTLYEFSILRNDDFETNLKGCWEGFCEIFNFNEK